MGLCVVALVILSHTGFCQSLSDVEQKIGAEINRYRVSHGLQPLLYDIKLSDIARGHSADMLTNQYFSHNSPTPSWRTVQDRLRGGWRFTASSAENLHKTEGCPPAALAEDAVKSWIASPPHHKNLANQRFNRTGIGLASQGGVCLFTQLFSYEPIMVEDIRLVPDGPGYQVTVTALVTDGPRQGSFFFQGKRLGDWQADEAGRFIFLASLPGPGMIEIGQLVANHDWSIELSVPVPLPPGPKAGI